MATRYVQALIRVESDDPLDEWTATAAAAGALDGHAVTITVEDGTGRNATVTVVVHEALEEQARYEAEVFGREE